MEKYISIFLKMFIMYNNKKGCPVLGQPLYNPVLPITYC